MPSTRINGLHVGYDDVGKGKPLVFVHGYPFIHSGILKSKRCAVPAGLSLLICQASVKVMFQTEPYRSKTWQCTSLRSWTIFRLRATLAGLSMGGYVVLVFYKEFAYRVAGLIR